MGAVTHVTPGRSGPVPLLLLRQDVDNAEVTRKRSRAHSLHDPAQRPAQETRSVILTSFLEPSARV